MWDLAKSIEHRVKPDEERRERAEGALSVVRCYRSKAQSAERIAKCQRAALRRAQGKQAAGSFYGTQIYTDIYLDSCELETGKPAKPAKQPEGSFFN